MSISFPVGSGVGQGTQMLKIVSHFHYIKPQFQSQFTQISDLTSTNFLKKGLLSNHSNAFRTKKKKFRTSLCAMTRKKKYAKGLVSIDKIPTRCFGPIFVKKSQKVMRIWFDFLKPAIFVFKTKLELSKQQQASPKSANIF